MNDATLQRYHQEVSRYQKRNFWCNVIDGNFWDFSTSFVAFGTIIPVFVMKLGGNNLAISLIPFLTIICLNLPAVFSLHHVQSLDRKKPYVLLTGALLRSSWFFAAIACWTLANDRPLVMLAVFMGCLVLFFAADGAGMSAWFDLVAKTVPVAIRGKMMSLRSSGGNLLGALGGVGAAAILAGVAYPHNYALLFLIAFVFYMVSLGCIALVHEPLLPIQNVQTTIRGSVSALLSAVRTDRNFAKFILSRAVATVAASSTAFYVVYAMKRYQLSESYSGVFTIAIVVSTILFGPMIGILADRRGHKANFVLSMTASALAALIILTTDGLGFIFPVLALQAVAQISLHISELSMTVEFCSAQDRPLYIAASQVLMAPVALVTLGFGSVADCWGYQSLFAIIAAAATLGAVFTIFRVRDPRRIAAPALAPGVPDPEAVA